MTIRADKSSAFTPNVNAINASVAGGSGAKAWTNDSTSATATVGDSAAIIATGTVAITASNTFTENTVVPSVQTGSGGVINGSSAQDHTTIGGTNSDGQNNNDTASVIVGEDASITSGSDLVSSPGGITIGASSSVTAIDSITQSAGGVVEILYDIDQIDVTLNNQVQIGQNAKLTSYGNIGIGTNTTIDAVTSADLYTYGLAGGGTADAYTNATSNQTVTVGQNANITAVGNINLTAGTDPTGLTTSTMTASSNAYAQAEGLAGVPYANPGTTATSNATLNVDTGTSISSGADVNIGAYPGSPNATQIGTTESSALWIPINGGGTLTTVTPKTSDNVTLNGTITAGILHDLTIDIPYPAGSTGYTSTCNVTDSGQTLIPPGTLSLTPITPTFESTFDPTTFIENTFSDAAEQQVLEGGVATQPVGAFDLSQDALYARGGSVKVSGTVQQSSGKTTITAYCQPTITVTNESPDYLVLGAMTIPGGSSGGVFVNGNAQQSGALTGNSDITISSVGSGQTPTVTIDLTYPNTVGGSSYGPALFLTGLISNPSGGVTIENDQGSYGQASTINAQQVTLKIKNGVAAIDTPSSPYNLQDEQAQWNSEMIWPGGNPSSGTPNPDAAISYVVNSMYDPSGTLTTAELNSQLYDTVGKTGPNNTVPTSIVFIGDSFPFVDGTDYGYNLNSAWTTAAGNSSSTPYTFNGGGESAYFPEIPNLTLTKTIASPTAPAPPSTPSLMGGGFAITAKLIDINGELDVGEATPAWSVTLGSAAAADIAKFKQQYNLGETPGSVYTVPSADVISTGGATLAASYDASTGKITLDDIVTPGLHGGSGYLNGAIISTNPRGCIKFKDGLGQVSVNNQTGIPVVLQNIDTGSTDTSTLDIIDTNKSGDQAQTLYVSQPGQPVTMYTGAATVDPDTLSKGPGSPVSGTSTSYDPSENSRLVWTDTATLARTQNVKFSSADYPTLAYNGTAVLSSGWLSDWTMNPWTQSTATITTTDAADENYSLVETITGTAANGELPGTIPYTTRQASATSYHEDSDLVQWQPFQYNNNYGFNNFGSGTNHLNWWNYDWPLSASLTLTMSLKADNPIGIDFSGVTAGSLTIASNAPVFLAGSISQAVGQTTITADGDITPGANASITADDLTLTATGGSIGNTAQPLNVTLGSNGSLKAMAGNQGVYLDLSSGANIAQITSGDATDGYGDVSITTNGDLLPQSGLPAGTVNITGGNITLTSTGGEVGNPGSPLVIQANSVPAANGGVLGGVVNVTAQGDVGLVQNSGDLLVGTIQSTDHGAVAVSAPGGSILNAATWVAGGLSLAQAEADWKALGLTDAAASQQAVTAFENQVNANYQQYWQLLGNGTVQNRSFTVRAGTEAVWNNATGGSFTLSTTVNGQTVTSGPITYDASAAAMQTALAPLLGGTLIVTGSGTQADPWLISATGLGLLTANDSQLTGGVSTVKPVPLGPQQVWTSATGGTFTLSAIVNAQTETTGPIAYNATAAAIQAALNSLAGVQASVTGSGTQTDPWLLSGTGLTFLSTNGGQLTGGASTLQVVPTGPQQMWCNATGGTFRISLVVNGQTETTAPIAYNASAAAVQSALNTLTGVQATVTGLGTAADPWLITGTGLAPLMTDGSQLTTRSTVQAAPAGASLLWNSATGGTFTLSLTVNGQTETTGPIAYNASAAGVQTALDNLAGVQAAVTGSGTQADPWLIRR